MNAAFGVSVVGDRTALLSVVDDDAVVVVEEEVALPVVVEAPPTAPPPPFSPPSVVAGAAADEVVAVVVAVLEDAWDCRNGKLENGNYKYLSVKVCEWLCLDIQCIYGWQNGKLQQLMHVL